MASPASTYSTVIACSSLRPRLVGTVETGLRRDIPSTTMAPVSPRPSSLPVGELNQ